MSLVVAPKNCDPSVRQAIQKLALKLGPTAEPTFTGLTLTDLTASRIIATDADKALESIDLNDWIAGTTDQITVTDDNDGTVTLSLPQDYDTGATPTLGGLTLVNAITEFSTDDTLGGDSDSAVPTEQAVKAYVDGLISGLSSTYQPLDDVLTDLSALAVVADNEFIVGTGAGAYAHESGATVRTSLGLGAGDSVIFAELDIDNININGDIISRTGSIYIDFDNGAGHDLVIRTGGDAGGNLILESDEGIVINSAWTATGQTCADLGTVSAGALHNDVTHTQWDGAYDHSIGTGSDHALLSATPGTVSASKAVIVDGSKDIDFDGGDITTTGWGRFDGGIAVGAAVSTQAGIRSAQTISSAAYYYGIYSLPTHTLTANNQGTWVAYGSTTQLGDYTRDQLGGFKAEVAGAAVVPGEILDIVDCWGFHFQPTFYSDTAGGSVDNLMGLEIKAPTAAINTTIDNAYALKLADYSAVGTASWAIYSAGGDSYHAGDIILEDPTNKDVSIGSDAAGYLDLKALTGIRFNNDIVLPKTSGKGIKIDTTTPTFGWRDLLGEISVKTVGANDPDYSDYAGTGIYRYQFKNTAVTEVFDDFHFPHDYVPGTEVYVHIHWSQTTIDTGGAAAVPGVAKWYFDANYSKGHDRGAFPAAVTTVSVTQTASGTIRKHMIAEVQLTASGQIGGQDLEPDGVVTVRTYRDSDDEADTLNQRPWVHHVDIHYQSTNIATKDKAFDFYT